MSAHAGTVPADATTALRRAPRDSRGTAAAGAPGSIAIELSVFAALAALALVQWSRLADGVAGGKLFAALVVALCGGAALATLGRAVSRPVLRRPLALLLAALTVAGTLVAVGLPVRLLLPSNWGELGDELHRGLSGIERSDLPYRGGDGWVALTAMLGAATLLGLAAVWSFWPGGNRRLNRLVGLALLTGMFGWAVTIYAPAAELAWGAALLVLIAAWLWLPQAGARSAPLALATALGACALAVPVAASLGDGAWWDWRHWRLFAPELSVRFDWDHRYGPLDWPQRGTDVLAVHSDEPHYWKVSVLDRFDGFRWERADIDDPLATTELAARRDPLGGDLVRRNPQWLSQPDFRLEALTSDLVVSAGQTQAVEGAGPAAIASDGTVTPGTQPLTRGDEYTATVYDPRPTPAKLRRVSGRYPARASDSTLVGLPPGPEPSDRVDGRVPTPYYVAPIYGELRPLEGTRVPAWGHPQGAARDAILASAYADVYRLARRWTADATSAYDAVASIKRHLRRGPYQYQAQVHNYVFALPAFLFIDRAGYCQQFSGTMALMLRMLGIPSRVATGFAPGEVDGGDYHVRDLDAHSWVEVFFPRVGWVTFDPTPAASPALTQGSDALGHPLIASERGAAANVEQDLRGSKAASGSTQPGAPADEGGGAWGAVGLGTAALAIAAAIAGGVAVVRRRSALAGGGLAQAQITELTAALERLGWPLPKRVTLRELERRFAAGGRKSVARYAAALGAHRFAGADAPPGPGERRALRRSLGSGGGLARRLRALWAIPPGGPSRRHHRWR
jgi:protein-glutamine gamma-glutamyltransferase